MTSITQVAQAMQAVLSEIADAAAHSTGFVQRESKMGGAEFVQTLIFGWLSNPQATLEELAQTAGTLGVEISPQGLDQRFTPSAAKCLRRVLDESITQLFRGNPVALPILRRFAAVYIQDSSVVELPKELADEWRGCGSGSGIGQAAVKIEVRMDLICGEMVGPLLEAGRINDAVSQIQSAAMPAGTLRMADLGYWSLADMRQQDEAGSFWLSRLKTQTTLLDQNGKPWEILHLLKAQHATQVELSVFLGAQQHLSARLLAVRVPQEVADQRRRRLHEEAQRRQKPLSKIMLALADCPILVTNLPAEMLSLPEALVLMRARWQIELLFKLWKSHGRIDEWRSAKPWRILCEVYAKLLAMLVQHWLFLVGCWQFPNRSLRKAAHTVQKHALHLASAFTTLDGLVAAIVIIQRCLATGCRINKRKTLPHTYQLLQNLTPETLA